MRKRRAHFIPEYLSTKSVSTPLFIFDLSKSIRSSSTGAVIPKVMQRGYKPRVVLDWPIKLV